MKDLSGFYFLKVIFLCRLFGSLFLLAFILLSFTFLGGLMINYKMYYPITWQRLRYIITITTMYLSSYSRLMMGDRYI